MTYFSLLNHMQVDLYTIAGLITARNLKVLQRILHECSCIIEVIK